MSSRRRERPIPNPTVEREMRELHAQLDAMETAHRCTVDVGYVSEAGSENEAGAEEEFVAKDVVEECLFRVLARMGAREKMGIQCTKKT
jgi:hypothetical protein